MNLFEQVFRALNKEKVKYLVVGGAAVNLYGYPRFTGDLDILLFLTEENVKKMDSVMKKLGYSERLPVSILDLSNRNKVKKWLEEKNMKAFTFNPPLHNILQIDVIIEESLKFEKFYKKKVVKSEGGVRVPVVSLDDLISMKKKAKRDKDKFDIRILMGLK